MIKEISFLFLFCALRTNADSLTYWDVSGVSATTASVLTNAWSDPWVRSNECVLTLSPVAAQNAFTGVNTYGWSNQVDTAFNANKYISWTVKPHDGAVLTVTNIYISLWRYGSGASNFVLRSSVGGFSSNLDAWSYGGNGACDRTVTFSSGLPISGTTEFRLYMWNGAAGAASTYLRVSSSKSINVKGTKSGALACDVTDYGAVPDDGLDDAPAFQEVLNVLAAGGGGTLYIPAGSFTFSNKVSLTAGNVNIGIIGSGNSISRLYCRNTNGLFNFNFIDNRAQLDLSYFTGYASSPRAGTALEVNAPTGGSGDGRSLTMTAVEFIADTSDITCNGFRRGVITDGMWRPFLEDVIVSGPYGPNAPTTNRYCADACFQFSNADQPVFKDCNGWGGAVGFNVGLRSSSTNPLFEGCAAVIVSNAYNVYAASGGTGTVSGVWIRGTHANGVDTGITLDHMKNFTLEDDLLYHSPEAELINSNYLDIVLLDSSSGVLRRNLFEFGNPRTQIYLDSGSTNICVTDNIFDAPSLGSPMQADSPGSVTVANNQFNKVHADETNTVALWHMDSALTGSPNYIDDDDMLNPARNNYLNLYGCYIQEGYTNYLPGNAIAFTRTNDYAQAAKNWCGAPGIRIDTYIWFDSNVGQQYVMTSGYTFRLQSLAKSIQFLWQNQNGVWQTNLAVANAISTGSWCHVTAEVNPHIKQASLEVEFAGRSSVEIGTDCMIDRTNSIILGQGSYSGTNDFLGKIDDTQINQL